MKKTFFLVTCIVTSIAISAFTTSIICKHTPSISNASSLDTYVFILTLIVAVLTFLIGIIGIIEFSRIQKYIKIVDKFVNKFEKKLNVHENEFEKIKYSLTQQEHYLNQTIYYLYQAADSITNQMNDQETALVILNQLYHNLQIAKLYRSSLDSNETSKIDNDKFTAFAYLEENGTMEDIPHLLYVERNDSNEQNRKRATGVIAIIKRRG